MRRYATPVRADWKNKVESKGLTYHTLADGSPYWDESAYWEFSAAEIDRIEAATAELQKMALAAGDFILKHDRFEQMGIPKAAAKRIRASWKAEPPSLYGRLDLACDGRDIKLLEYNADTPTALLEAAVTQWYWLEECFPESDQFNSLHEKLVAKWKQLSRHMQGPVYFAADVRQPGSDEDWMTIEYLRETAAQAGLRNATITMGDIGWEKSTMHFVDLDRQPIKTIFKLYPWEWLLQDKFSVHALDTMNQVQWIEPIWKMMWSNKALLAVLWEMYPRHPLLLPSYLDGPRELRDCVRKPLLGREGEGISIHRAPAPPPVSDGRLYVYQGLARLAQADGNYAVLGSWLVDGESAGMGIRESKGPITNNTCRFVPHLIRS